MYLKNNIINLLFILGMLFCGIFSMSMKPNKISVKNYILEVLNNYAEENNCMEEISSSIYEIAMDGAELYFSNSDEEKPVKENISNIVHQLIIEKESEIDFEELDFESAGFLLE